MNKCLLLIAAGAATLPVLAACGWGQLSTAPATTAPAVDPGPAPTLGAPPPSNETVVLYDGSGWSGWRQRDGAPSQWFVASDDSIHVKGGDAISEQEFGDLQLHLEFRVPEMPAKAGQARGNSGVYVHGRYEVQVLDTYGQPAASNGCGGIYALAPPLVNAARPAGTWQAYDIVFRAPRFDAGGTVTQRPRMTVIHNGIVIHNNVELPGTTAGGLDQEMVATGPLLLQDHGDPVRYRNIWVRPLDEMPRE